MIPLFSILYKCRKVKDRPRDPANWNEIADVVASLSIPVIANGDVFEYEDFERIKSTTGNKNLTKLFISAFVYFLPTKHPFYQAIGMDGTTSLAVLLI